MIEVKTVVDSRRGCGWRKPGGIYLRCDLPGAACGKLPLPLTVCPCCHAGIKPARGWTWFEPRSFFEKVKCAFDNCNASCVLSSAKTIPERAGLLWIGEKFYATPDAWLDEAKRQGISRRISGVPKDFEAGKTYVFVAHRKAIRLPSADDDPKWQGAIFQAFRPTRVEYVVKGDETQEELEALVKRGLVPVNVQREGELQPALCSSK